MNIVNNPQQHILPTLSWDIGGPSSANADAPAYLTPDALMAYCQSRLSNLDSQIQGLMTKQQNVGTEQQKIQKLLQEVAKLQSSCGSNGCTSKDPVAAQKLEQDIEDTVTWLEQNDPGCAQISDLKNLHDTVMATGSGPYNDNMQLGTIPAGNWHGYYGDSSGTGTPSVMTPPSSGRTDQDSTFGSDELKGFSDTLTGINNSLSSSAELGMIQIQSFISQRSTAIQLVTNMMQSINDGVSKVVGNIGH